MTPISFTVKNGVTHFHYKASELIPFARLGFREGNVGMILVRREGRMFTYKGFGTIENPITTIQTLTLIHHEVFDGKMLSDEEILIPPKPLFTSENISFSFFMFDA